MEREIVLRSADRDVEEPLIEWRVRERIVHAQHDDGVILQTADIGNPRQDRASDAALLPYQGDVADAARLAEFLKPIQVGAVPREHGDAGVR